MKITNETITKIEEIFGFVLHDWQKDYLLGKSYDKPNERQSGRTFAYCVGLLLSDGEKISGRDLTKYIDAFYGSNYPYWFRNYALDINQALVDAGFETRIEV